MAGYVLFCVLMLVILYGHARGDVEKNPNMHRTLTASRVLPWLPGNPGAVGCMGCLVTAGGTVIHSMI